MYAYHANYVDAVANRMRPSDSHVYLADANFNVTALLEPDSTVIERYEYAPYGEVTVLDANFSVDSDGLSDVANTILYTGRWKDPNTGLQLNRNRWYHPPLGRWVTRDPIDYEGGANLYGYVVSRPTYFLDPTGLITMVTYPIPLEVPEGEVPEGREDVYVPAPGRPGYCCDRGDSDRVGAAKEFCKKNNAVPCEIRQPSDLKKCLDDEDECVDDLRIGGHGNVGRQYIGPVDRGPGRLGIGAVDGSTDLGPIFGGRENFCPGCTIYLGGCLVAQDRALMKRIANQTGCKVLASKERCSLHGGKYPALPVNGYPDLIPVFPDTPVIITWPIMAPGF